jgi:hypothetical protein
MKITRTQIRIDSSALVPEIPGIDRGTATCTIPVEEQNPTRRNLRSIRRIVSKMKAGANSDVAIRASGTTRQVEGQPAVPISKMDSAIPKIALPIKLIKVTALLRPPSLAQTALAALASM